jgi:immune inhibitor A
MPPHPELVERMAKEGTLSKWQTYMEDLRERGINNIEGNKVYNIAPGMTLVTIQRESIVIIVDFDDNTADTGTYPASHYEDLLFSVGTYPTGSMRDYYLENSYGNFETVGEISGWHRMPQDYSYYVDGQNGFGSYPQNAQRLTEDAVYAADPYVDFSQYDNDGPDGIPDSGDDDGWVDALFVVHAGPGAEVTGSDHDIWSHAWGTYNNPYVDGVYVGAYSQEPEDGDIGVFCHELGHVLGIPDFYDYGYDSRGVGYWSVMAGGSWGGGGVTPVHFDAYSKVLLGFVTPIVPTSNLVNVLVPQVETNAVVYKIWTDGLPGDEYFMLENRQQTGFDVSIRGEGIVIYHVDDNTYGNDNQRCGSGSPHYQLAVEQADGECELEYNTSSGDAGDPWPGSGGAENPNYAFDNTSTPNTRDYSNSPTDVEVYDISMVGNDGYVSIKVTDTPADTEDPVVTVTAPNGGETWYIDSFFDVTWTATDNIGVTSIDILLSTDGGATYPRTLATGEANDGTFSWLVDEPPTTQARIKVIAYDAAGNSGEDTSDADFTIADNTNPVVTVIQPNGGEVWEVGQTYDVTWTATDASGVAYVDISFSDDGGLSYISSISGEANDGVYSWLVDMSPTTQARVRVMAYDIYENNGYDVSDANFTIADNTPPSVTVTQPNGGETWDIGMTYDITWTATDASGVDYVDIWFSNDGGGSYISTISLGEANDGTYSWLVDVSPTTQARVRVRAYDIYGNDGQDESDADFEIYDPLAGVIAEKEMPSQLVINGNTPNPFSGRTTVRFGIPREGRVNMAVYDVSGRLVTELLDESYPAGYHAVEWASEGDVATGLYFIRLRLDRDEVMHKAVISR